MAYSRVLRRRTRPPYLDIIQAQGPAARSAKYLEEERALAEEGMELQRESLEQQGVEARDRLALTREGMELGASQAEKAQQIQLAQTIGLGAYGAHKVYKGLAGPKTTVPAVAPTGPNLPVTTSKGMVTMGPGTTGTTPVTPAPATTFAPTETGALPIKTAGRTVMMEPGVTAPGTAALATPGGAAAMPGIQTTGVAPGGAGTLETVGGETAGLSLGPTVKAGGTALAIEAAHQTGRAYAPKIAAAMPGGEKEWRKGMGIAARTGQGAAIGSVVPGVGTGIGAAIGATIGTAEAAKETIYDIPVVGKVWEEAGNVLEDVMGGAGDLVGCIIYTYFYGPHSREKRYARIFCARHMTKERYLGYIAAGTKVIDLAKKYPWLRDTLKAVMPEPYFRYMMYKLKGGKLSIRDRIAAMLLNRWFDWEAERLGDNIVINDNLRSCYHNAGGRMS